MYSYHIQGLFYAKTEYDWEDAALNDLFFQKFVLSTKL